MLNAHIHTLLLVVAGSVGVFVGGSILADPIAFHAIAGIEVANQPALLNEMRAEGGAIAALGLLALAGAVFARIKGAASLATACVYLGFGLSRLVAFALDGVPNATLIAIAGFELLIGLTCALALAPSRRLETDPP
jgi:hypothetical protein